MKAGTTPPKRQFSRENNLELTAIQKIWRGLREYHLSLIVLLLLSLIEAIVGGVSLSLLVPITQALTGANEATKAASHLFPSWLSNNAELGIAILGASITSRAALGATRSWLAISIAENLRKKLQIQMVGHVIQLDLPTLNSNPKGIWIENALNVTDKAAMFVLKFFTYLSQGIVLLGLIGILLVVSWQSGIILFTASFLVWLLVGRKYFSWSSWLGTRKVSLGQSISGKFSAALSSAKEIKITDSETFWTDQIQKYITQLFQVRVTSKLASAMPIFLAQFLVGLVLFCFGVVAPLTEIEWVDTLPLAVFFATTIYRIINQMMQVAVSRFGALNLLYAFDLAMIKPTQEERTREVLKEFKHDPNTAVVSLQNITFRYPDTPHGQTDPVNVLNGLNLTIMPGEITGLFGPSGSGKTTIIDLIAGIYPPTSGKVMGLGQDLANSDLTVWRSHIGYVQQEPVLFNATVRDNICVGRIGFDDEAIIRACRIAMVTDFMSMDKDGLDMIVQEDGTNLSGGQIRRLAIARAIVTNPKLIILDETGSSFGEQMEHEIIKGLSHELNAAIIVISHRASTSDWVDKSITLKATNVG